MKEMKILLADDHAALRSALRFWIEEQLVAQVFEVKEAEALLPTVEKIAPDILRVFAT